MKYMHPYMYPETLDELYEKLSPRMKEYAIEYAELTDTNNPHTAEMIKNHPDEMRDRLNAVKYGMIDMSRQLDNRSRVEALDVTLDELSESDEFMKRVMEADAATRSTELEHGFKFCRSEPNGKIAFGPLCTGSWCGLEFDDEKSECPEFSNTFHTHPTVALQTRSMWSGTDFLSTASSSNLAHAPRIGCVKSIGSDTIWCEKMQIEDRNLLDRLISIAETPIPNSEFDTRQQVYDELHTLAKSSATTIPVTDVEPRPTFKPTGNKHHPYLGGAPLVY